MVMNLDGMGAKYPVTARDADGDFLGVYRTRFPGQS
jgi:hypothetical protein